MKQLTELHLPSRENLRPTGPQLTSLRTSLVRQRRRSTFDTLNLYATHAFTLCSLRDCDGYMFCCYPSRF